ncbi:MAG: efflux RND transporter periplasmic adaptor subunit [Rhodospirillales bacterium]|nr:efflux RND transporter periplasmic adaptor subunit [Rhodospirillales bacterium]
MTPTPHPLKKRLLIIPPILVGLAVVALFVAAKNGPTQSDMGEAARKARVIEVPETTVIPRALGFGTVTPGTVWEALAEIQGKIVYIHPHLKAGAILTKGTVVLRIDPADYQLASGEAKADIRAIEAQLAELAARGKNTRASLAIDQKTLEISRRELNRKRQLLRSRAVSQAAVDLEERNLLDREQSVQNLTNILNLMPSENNRLNAQLAVTNIRLEIAKRNLERATITLPFDARIAKVNAELAQFAKSGQTLIIADSIDVSEVSAQLPIDKMLQLLDPSRINGIKPVNAMHDIENLLGLTPIIRLKSGNLTVEWKGRVARVSDRVDPSTRTIGVIVAVDDPYQVTKDGLRPPLAKNMYVEVELRGSAQEKQLVIPRTAIRGGKAFVVGADNRLRIRDIVVRFYLGDIAVLKSGLKAGERIIVSDIIPAIDGMLIDPAMDLEAASRLIAQAGGEASF